MYTDHYDYAVLAAGNAHGSGSSTTSNSTTSSSSSSSNSTTSASGSTSTNSGHGGGGSKSQVYRNRMPLMIWWIIGGTILFIALLHWTSRLISYYKARKATQQRKKNRDASPSPTSEKEKVATITQPDSKPTSPLMISRTFRALNSGWGNIFYLRTLPLWIYSSTSISEIFWTVAYAGIATGVVCYALVGDKRTDNLGRLDFSNPFGLAAYAQVPLIVGLASKNNVISWFTGISYQKLNYLHRASARVCLLHSWIHVYGRITLGVGKGTKFEVSDPLMIWGIIAIIGISVSYLTSFRLIRHYLYEFFLITHIIFVFAFLLGAFYHYDRFNQYIWPGLLLWSLDRVTSLCRMIWINKYYLLPFTAKRANAGIGECTVELVDSEVMRVTVKTAMKWKAGQHAFLTMPSVATLRYEQHPFTIASADVPNMDSKAEAVFLIRAYDGFTRRLLDSLESEKTTALKAYLDGPYGLSTSLEGNDTVVLLAGGTGISHALSNFLQVIHSRSQSQSTNSSQIRHVRLIWNVRHAHHLKWIAPMLNTALISHSQQQSTLGGLDIRIVLHVTRSHMSDEPGDDRGISDAVGTTAGNVTHLHPQAHSHTHGRASMSMDEKTIRNLSASSSEAELDNQPSSSSGTGSPTLEGSQSLSSSVDDLNEKPRSQSHSLIPYGVTEDVAGFITLAKGRVDVASLLEDVLLQAQGSVHVSVCGPEELALSTRRAVAEVNSVKRVFNGQHPIEYHGETYGW